MSAAPAPVRLRHYSPKEFAAALADLGIPMSEDRIRERCRLSSRHDDRIATNRFFSGRWLIPETELDRIAGGNRA